jgi:hypothetical protein
LDSFLGVLSECEVAVERSDAYTFLVLSSLPWVASQLRDRNFMELERIFQTLHDYMTARPERLAASGIPDAVDTLSLYRDSAINVPYIQKDYLELTWTQIQDLKQNDWETYILSNPFSSHSHGLSGQLQHDVPPVIVPSSVTHVKFIYQPKVWIFNDSVNVPGQVRLWN